MKDAESTNATSSQGRFGPFSIERLMRNGEKKRKATLTSFSRTFLLDSYNLDGKAKMYA